MKRDLKNTINTCLNHVVHGGSAVCYALVESTGTEVTAKRINSKRVDVQLILRGDDNARTSNNNN